MKNLVFVIALAMLTTGCSTIMTGSHDKVTVTTENNSAQEFEVLNEDGIVLQKGTTPQIVELPTKGDSSFVYLTACDAQLEESDLNGWVFGNLIFGGLIGIVVDLVTGYSNEPVADVNITDCNTTMVVSKD